MRLAWLLAALFLASALALIQYAALEHLLYWRYIWLDTFVHFLGGLTVAVFFIGFSRTVRVRAFLLCMVAVALGWELFEFGINAEREANFGFATALDLLMDALVMSAAYILARFTLWRSA